MENCYVMNKLKAKQNILTKRRKTNEAMQYNSKPSL